MTHIGKKIVVTTPTGHVGSRVVRLLLQAGVRPTLLVRDPARLDAATRDRVDIVQCDQGDSDAVRHATRGANRLFWVNPPAPADSDPIAHYVRMGTNAAHAVEANGIGHVVFLSSVGAEKRTGAGEIDGLARTELLLEETSAEVVHLRCGYFFTNLLMDLAGLRAGQLPTSWPLDYPMAWVNPRDIGEVAAARLLSDWSGRQRQAVHGPQDLTFAEVAAILSRVLGHPVRATRISHNDLRTTLRAAGLSPDHAEGIAGMSAGLSEGFHPEDARSIITTTPTALAAWAHEHLAPLVGTS